MESIYNLLPRVKEETVSVGAATFIRWVMGTLGKL